MNLPLGFRYAAAYAGLRKIKKDDVALIVSDTPAVAAAVFTQNRVVAAPVLLARKNLRVSRGKVSAILVNAGNANCATRTGEQVALSTIRAAAKALGVKPHYILPASTGVIGVEMDGGKIVAALPALAGRLNTANFEAVAAAIMTTDTVAKTAYAEVKSGRQVARIAAMTKGSGMIQPNMATTLGFVVSDAVVSPAALRSALKRAINSSYNRISVDGDTSTNDTVAVLANGASGVKPSTKAFETALTSVLESLAQQIARDGEGARKLVTIYVEGAANEKSAERIARSIANSPLVKTAIAGSDPNWGRVLCAAGYAGVVFDPRKTDIDMQGVAVCRAGLAADFDEAELKCKLDRPDCYIRFAIRGGGHGRARFWTCDFTEDYIRINASYRT
ncbi:MAG TPA: bifunctional glutamate N-acetyltransferase/amino-acid acetyltransferase ArgJ [Bryobacteraceae bacterium]|nr:bifunctional glutamate N-acetyltransferase/amino-acid acetyltransferase ArgJ [Bryobacteraceae bacterium]